MRYLPPNIKNIQSFCSCEFRRSKNSSRNRVATFESDSWHFPKYTQELPAIVQVSKFLIFSKKNPWQFHDLEKKFLTGHNILLALFGWLAQGGSATANCDRMSSFTFTFGFHKLLRRNCFTDRASSLNQEIDPLMEPRELSENMWVTKLVLNAKSMINLISYFLSSWQSRSKHTWYPRVFTDTLTYPTFYWPVKGQKTAETVLKLFMSTISGHFLTTIYDPSIPSFVLQLYFQINKTKKPTKKSAN